MLSALARDGRVRMRTKLTNADFKKMARNCVFLCVFRDKQYVDLLFMVLESLYAFGNLWDGSTDVLVYTNSCFADAVRESVLFSPRIKFEINDEYCDLDEVCKARLDFFQLPSAAAYDTILYLDTDVLIVGDINRIFAAATQNVLYAVEQGAIDDFNVECNIDFWGKTLFEDDELRSHSDKRAFTSGMLLFRNCIQIQSLFDSIKEDMRRRTHRFFDQPFIVYNTFKHGLRNIDVLGAFAENVSYETEYAAESFTKSICHFPGGVGNIHMKLFAINRVLNAVFDCSATRIIADAKRYFALHLMPIVLRAGVRFVDDFDDLLDAKLKCIARLLSNQRIVNIAQLGFGAGMTALTMLLANHRLQLTCFFSEEEHTYALPCYQALKQTFVDRIDLVCEDRIETKSSFDLIHITIGDGDPAADVNRALTLSHPGSVIIVDFTSLPLGAPPPRVHPQGVERASAMLSALARDPQNLHDQTPSHAQRIFYAL